MNKRTKNCKIKIIASLLLVTFATTILCACNSETSKATKIQAMNPQRIAAGQDHALILEDDGTVRVVCEHWDKGCDIDDWTDIVSVDACGSYSFGLKADGTVVYAASENTAPIDTITWENLVQLSGTITHIAGLLADGTVVVQDHTSLCRSCDTSSWKDIVYISAGHLMVFGINSNGDLLVTGDDSYSPFDTTNWNNLIKVEAGDRVIGLKKDGTVVTDSINQPKMWTDIIDVSAGHYFYAAVKSDGTAEIYYPGDNKYVRLDGWKDIVAISSCVGNVYGLRADGTVMHASA